MSQQTSNFFHEYAADFDSIYGTTNTWLNRLVNQYFRRSMRLRFEKTLEGCQPAEGRSVLDIGCGPGHFALALACQGASPVFGVDFADGMLDVARRHAEEAHVGDRCTFEFGDFFTHKFESTYDYTIVMGFMDYMERPRTVVEKVLSLTNRKAFFSFPLDGGFLAWQRKLRYRNRCPLYMYTPDQVRGIFQDLTTAKVTIEQIDRDLFVTADLDQDGSD